MMKGRGNSNIRLMHFNTCRDGDGESHQRMKCDTSQSGFIISHIDQTTTTQGTPNTITKTKHQHNYEQQGVLLYVCVNMNVIRGRHARRGKEEEGGEVCDTHAFTIMVTIIYYSLIRFEFSSALDDVCGVRYMCVSTRARAFVM